MIGDRKVTIATIAEKNRRIQHIIDAIVSCDRFLLIGHKSPDEDCIASLVGFALMLSKFGKTPLIFLSASMNNQFEYLLNICRYNSIGVVNSFGEHDGPIDVVAILDTPKPDMANTTPAIDKLLADPAVLKIEIDHHIGADGAYNADTAYALVLEASSAAELVGHIALKLSERPDILSRYQINDLFSRNLVLALLTGIIADTNMGEYIKSRREKRYYEIFSNMFNTMLTRDTVKESNFADMKELFSELRHLSNKEEDCFKVMMKRKKKSKSIAYVVMGEREMNKMWAGHDTDTVVGVSRTVTDRLAEESGVLGMVAYYDNPRASNLIQFRLRRSQSFKGFDLRDVLTLLSIENGGGHEGAIGFRFPKTDINDLAKYVESIVPKIEKALSAPRA